MERASPVQKVVTALAITASLVVMVAARAPRNDSTLRSGSLYSVKSGNLDEFAVRRHHEALVREAHFNYVFGVEKSATEGDTAVIGVAGAEEVSQFTAAEAVRRDDPDGTQPREIIAKLYVDHDYPRLGLVKGNNYIFVTPALPPRGSVDKVRRTYVVVPEDVNAEMRYLTIDPAKQFGHHPPAAVIAHLGNGRVVLGCCLDDPGCGSGHCGATDAGGRYTGKRPAR